MRIRRTITRLITRLVVCAAAGGLLTACATGPVHAKSKRGASKPGASVVLTDRTVDVIGGISDALIAKAQARLHKLDKMSHDPVWIRINSSGGSVQAGLILLDTMKALKSPTKCLVESKAYSMAAILLVFCDERYALDHATLMLHEASFGFQGEDPTNRSRMKFVTSYLDGIHAEIAEVIGMKDSAYRAKLRDAWWLLADEAVEANIIDTVVTHIDYRPSVKTVTETKHTKSYQTTVQEVPSSTPQPKVPKRP